MSGKRYSFFVKSEYQHLIAVLDNEVKAKELSGENVTRSSLILEAIYEYLSSRELSDPVELPSVTVDPPQKLQAWVPKTYHWFSEAITQIVNVKRQNGKKASLGNELFHLALHGLLETKYGERVRNLLK